MLLRTESFEELEEDIAELFDSVPEYIYEHIAKLEDICDPFDEDVFNDLLNKYIEDECNFGAIDTISVYHLAVAEKGRIVLEPLDRVLTNNSSVSKILAQNGIYGKNKNGHIVLNYKGRDISEDYVKCKSPLLAKRLGYLGNVDYCINGFSFWMDIKNDSYGYYERLEHGPEFLQFIDELLGTTTAKAYREKYHYYGIVFEVPLKVAIFDSIEDISLNVKRQLIIRNSLKALLRYYKKALYEDCNIHIRIPDTNNAKISKYIKVCE